MFMKIEWSAVAKFSLLVVILGLVVGILCMQIAERSAERESYQDIKVLLETRPVKVQQAVDVGVNTRGLKLEIFNKVEDNFTFRILESNGTTAFTSGNTSCGETPKLQVHEYQSSVKSTLGFGYWLTVESCGAESPNDVIYAKIYLPHEAFDRVVTFYDFRYAVVNYGEIYWINQVPLANILGKDVFDLPANQTLFNVEKIK